MDALRDLLTPTERMTITTTSAMVIITSDDGRTVRLLTDGSEIKDESTRVTRRSRWVNGTLVSEISGLIRGKASETYSIDVDSGRLTLKVHVDDLPQAPEGERRRRRRNPNEPLPANEPETSPDSPSSSPEGKRRDAGSSRDRTLTRVYDRVAP